MVKGVLLSLSTCWCVIPSTATFTARQASDSRMVYLCTLQCKPTFNWSMKTKAKNKRTVESVDLPHQAVTLSWRSKCSWVNSPVTRCVTSHFLSLVQFPYHSTNINNRQTVSSYDCFKGKSVTSLCVSVWFSYEPKSKLSKAVATDNVLLQWEMCEVVFMSVFSMVAWHWFFCNPTLIAGTGSLNVNVGCLLVPVVCCDLVRECVGKSCPLPSYMRRNPTSVCFGM